MATLLMHPDHHTQRRTKKTKNGQKKQPQRGLGVAQLEKLRMQEESRKIMLAFANGSSPDPFSAVCFTSSASFQSRMGMIKQPDPASPGSCKSGLSSDVSAAHKPGVISSSPSPCSSQHNRGEHEEIGDESSKSVPYPHESTKFLQNNPINSPRSNPFEMFDPSFRARRLVHPGDCRDWPGAYPAPAIKELSSFQIPGNTPPFSSGSRPGPWWSGVRDGLSDIVRDGSSEVGPAIAEPRGSSIKIISPPASPRSLSAACFSFEGTSTAVKDSCSSSLNNLKSGLNQSLNSSLNHGLTSSLNHGLNSGLSNCLNYSLNQNKFNTSSSACDFLALSLSTTNAKRTYDKFSSSSEDHQEASGETKGNNLVQRKSAKVMKGLITLDLSLKVPSADESSLDLKLAL